MTRRLESLSSSNLNPQDSNSAKAIEEAGFDPEVKKRLLERISSASPRLDNPRAFAEAELPTSAGAGSRLIASAEPWTGTESIHDSTLRMLDDSQKRIRVPNRMPSPAGMQRPPRKVDTGRSAKGKGPGSGTRLANARDRSSMYSYLRDESLSEKERDQMRAELKERFTPGARPMPTTLQGLASLANERIEDAIARGQFKNLPRGRGKHVERDHSANSPFIDTTEYFMNKIIQKQEIVPPWIEKQQELSQAAARFRGGLRASWKRHVARSVASWGGPLQDQMRRADQFARAEIFTNPLASKRRINDAPLTEAASQSLNFRATLDPHHMSQISNAGQLTISPATPLPSEGLSHESVTTAVQDLLQTTTVLNNSHSDSSSDSTPAISTNQPDSTQTFVITDTSTTTISSTSLQADTTPSTTSLRAFRDASWTALEQPFHTATIASLNALTRTYNLQAPPSARKPYFSLDRELLSCYADVAPLVAGEIRARALAPRVSAEKAAGEGLLGQAGIGSLGSPGRFAGHEESRERSYGFKELWRDLWGKAEVR